MNVARSDSVPSAAHLYGSLARMIQPLALNQAWTPLPDHTPAPEDEVAAFLALNVRILCYRIQRSLLGIEPLGMVISATFFGRASSAIVKGPSSTP